MELVGDVRGNRIQDLCPTLNVDSAFLYIDKVSRETYQQENVMLVEEQVGLRNAKSRSKYFGFFVLI